MDLSIVIKDTKLKIRAAAILPTLSGFLFERSDKDYIFTIGGKIMINETSEEAIKREVMEEIGMRIEKLSLCSVIENIYTNGNEKVHEICFVYKVDTIFRGSIPIGFVEVSLKNIDNYIIKPTYIIDILKQANIPFRHFMIK